MKSALREAAPALPAETLVKEGFDFAEIAETRAVDLKPDFLIGSSKGYSIARELKVPLIRVGFPIHDRIGGQRVLHLGYRGAQELYDRIVNALLEVKQETSPVGYATMTYLEHATERRLISATIPASARMRTRNMGAFICRSRRAATSSAIFATANTIA